MNKTEDLIEKLKVEISENLKKKIFRLPTEKHLCESFRISRRTLRRALSALSEEGYLYSIQGSGYYLHGLSPKARENHLALLLSHPDSYRNPELIHDLRGALGKAGYLLDIYDVRGDFQREREILSSLFAKTKTKSLNSDQKEEPIYRGIFTESIFPYESPNTELYESLSARGVELLFLNPPYPNLSLPSVFFKDYEAVRNGIELLKRHGRAHIFGIFSPDIPEQTSRFTSFLRVLREEGLSFSPNSYLLLNREEEDTLEETSVISTGKMADRDMENERKSTGERIAKENSKDFIKDSSRENNRNKEQNSYCIERLLNFLRRCSQQERPALLCGSDRIACRILTLAEKLSISIPEELAILSFDDTYLARLGEVQLSSFRAENFEELSAEWMIKRLKGEQPRSPLISYTLSCYDSVKTLG